MMKSTNGYIFIVILWQVHFFSSHSWNLSADLSLCLFPPRLYLILDQLSWSVYSYLLGFVCNPYMLARNILKWIHNKFYSFAVFHALFVHIECQLVIGCSTTAHTTNHIISINRCVKPYFCSKCCSWLRFFRCTKVFLWMTHFNLKIRKLLMVFNQKRNFFHQKPQ